MRMAVVLMAGAAWVAGAPGALAEEGEVPSVERHSPAGELSMPVVLSKRALVEGVPGETIRSRVTAVIAQAGSDDVVIRKLSLVLSGHTSGEAPPGILIRAGAGIVHLEDVEIRCEGADRTAIEIVGNVRVSITGLRIEGPCRRGLALGAGAVSRLTDVSISGAVKNALHLVDAKVRLRRAVFDVEDENGREGVAIFSARSAISGGDVQASGGEFVIQASGGIVDLDGLTVVGRRRAGLTLSAISGRIRRLRVQGAFGYAALQIAGRGAGPLEIDSLEILRAGSAGILALRSDLRLLDLTVSGVRRDGDADFGHAVHLQESRAVVGHLEVDDAEGYALYSSNSTVQLDEVRARHVLGGVAAVNGSLVDARAVVVERPALVGVFAVERSVVTLEGGQIDVEVGQAICDGASFTSTGVLVDARRDRSRCSDRALNSLKRRR